MALGVYWLGLQRLPALNDANWAALKQFLRDFEWAGNVPVSVFKHPNSPHLKYSEAKDKATDGGSLILGTQLINTDAVNVDAFKAELAKKFSTESRTINPSEISNTTLFRTTIPNGYNVRVETFLFETIAYFRLSLFGWVEGQGWPTPEESFKQAKLFHDANIVLFWGEGEE